MVAFALPVPRIFSISNCNFILIYLEMKLFKDGGGVSLAVCKNGCTTKKLLSIFFAGACKSGFNDIAGVVAAVLL